MLDRDKLKNFLEELCHNFDDEWLLVGGSLVRLDINENRGTHDIDLVNFKDQQSDLKRAEIITWARGYGLDPEAFNSAASYFVKQVPQWNEHRVLLIQGAKGRIYRPTRTLLDRRI